MIPRIATGEQYIGSPQERMTSPTISYLVIIYGMEKWWRLPRIAQAHPLPSEQTALKLLKQEGETSPPQNRELVRIYMIEPELIKSNVCLAYRIHLEVII